MHPEDPNGWAPHLRLGRAAADAEIYATTSDDELDSEDFRRWIAGVADMGWRELD